MHGCDRGSRAALSALFVLAALAGPLPHTARCPASYYYQPQLTASGQLFNPEAYTAAHRSLPMGSRVRVTNPATGRSVVVRINDRGPSRGNRCLDLARTAFHHIAPLSAGVVLVRYEVLAG